MLRHAETRGARAESALERLGRIYEAWQVFKAIQSRQDLGGYGHEAQEGVQAAVQHGAVRA